jgi:hypothetical protein
MKKTKIQLADERVKKKISQLLAQLETENETGQIDWHSRAHYLRDALSAAVAINEYAKRNP